MTLKNGTSLWMFDVMEQSEAQISRQLNDLRIYNGSRRLSEYLRICWTSIEAHKSLHWLQNVFSPRLDSFRNHACGHYLINDVALTASGIDVIFHMAGCDSIIV